VLLVAISVIAAALFLYNVRQQGWLLPSSPSPYGPSSGPWWPTSTGAGAGTGSQPRGEREGSSLHPGQITATTFAYNLQSVTSQPFQGNAPITASEVTGNSPTAQANQQSLSNVPLLDPTIMGSTFTKEQGSVAITA